MNKSAEKIATITFVIFLVWVFIYAYFYVNFYPGFNHDILLIKNSNFVIDYGSMSHALPILGVLIYKAVPTQVIIWLSPFAIVNVYLFLYFLVSKRIIYWYPLTILIPLYHTTLVPSVIDWLLLPIVYNILKKGHEEQAVVLSVIMVYIHGPFAFVYLPILFLFLNRKKELFWITVFSLPQLLPLLYFSQGYTSYVREYFFIFSVFGHYLFTMSYYYWRILILLIYIGVFLVLLIEERKYTM
jgi:hypothetical protein